MSLQLDFGHQFGYLLAAYCVVAIALGGYFASLVKRERDLDRRDRTE